MSSDFQNGGQDDAATSNEWVTLRIFPSHNSARLAAAKLEANGIACSVTADDCGGWYPNLTTPGGVRLLVRPATVEAATVLLDSQLSAEEQAAFQASPPQSQELEPGMSEAAKDKMFSPFAFVGGLLIGVLLCLAYQWVSRQGEKIYRYDENKDGRADQRWVYQNGYASQFVQDRNFDGKWDFWVDYDDHGRRIKSRFDQNFDGQADGFGTFSNGELVSYELDTDFNGTPDVTFTYKYDLLQQADWKPNGSSNITMREIYQNGVLSEIQRDLDGAGKFDEVVKYDPFSNPISTNAFKLSSSPSK